HTRCYRDWSSDVCSSDLAQATELEQVVAIGYGTAARRELTGAVSSVSADQIAAAPVTSLEQSLLGRASGVQVVTSSGQPGAGARSEERRVGEEARSWGWQ